MIISKEIFLNELKSSGIVCVGVFLLFPMATPLISTQKAAKTNLRKQERQSILSAFQLMFIFKCMVSNVTFPQFVFAINRAVRQHFIRVFVVSLPNYISVLTASQTHQH